MEKKGITAFALVIGSFTVFGAQCRSCGIDILENDKFCPNCGRERYEETLAVQKPEIPAHVPQPSHLPAFQEQWRQKNYDNQFESGSSDGVGEHLLGMGRGLVTTVLSPLNIVRGMVTGCLWIEASGLPNAGGEAILYGSPFFIAVGAAMGSFATCADAINGSLDMVTAGYYGDWLYDSKGSGKPTPWVWEREWDTSAVPWINRK